MYMTNPGWRASGPRNASSTSSTLPVIAASPVSRARSMAARHAGSTNMSIPIRRTLGPVEGSLYTTTTDVARTPGGRTS